jgi:hypothetical protein
MQSYTISQKNKPFSDLFLFAEDTFSGQGRMNEIEE